MGVADELPQLREGYLLDYDMRTWEVTQHTAYDDPRWPADEWTLETGDDLLFLEYEYDDGDVFLLYERIEMTDVTAEGEPLRAVVRDEEPPATLAYEDTEYTLIEEGTGTRMIDDRTNDLHYWDYASDDDVLGLERYGSGDWSVYVGREVEPYEFDNILPRATE